jgi:hypothetical protein
MVSPDSQAIACPLSGRNSTYRPVQISGTGSKYGFKIWADAHRLVLAEVYLQIIAGEDVNLKVPLATLLRNLPVLLNIMLTASSRIRALIGRVLENSHFDPAGVHVGHAKMILGLLYKSKKSVPLQFSI